MVRETQSTGRPLLVAGTQGYIGEGLVCLREVRVVAAETDVYEEMFVAVDEAEGTRETNASVACCLQYRVLFPLSVLTSCLQRDTRQPTTKLWADGMSAAQARKALFGELDMRCLDWYDHDRSLTTEIKWSL
eukprot:763025-Hanusia_phi.AAC.5